MPDTAEPYLTYIIFRKEIERGPSPHVIMIADKGRLAAAKADILLDEPSGPPSDREGLETSPNAEHSAPGPQRYFSQLMGQFRETISGYHALIIAARPVVPKMRSRFLHDSLYRATASTLPLIEDDGKCLVFGVTLERYTAISHQFSRLRSLDSAASVFPGAILLSLVATFDSLVSDLIRFCLKLHPDRLRKSDKKLTASAVFGMRSFDDVLDHIIDGEIDPVMRDSHAAQIEYMQEQFSIKVKSDFEPWNEFIEIFERRNLAAHGDMIVDDKYLKNCKFSPEMGSPPERGSQLALSSDYLLSSSNTLMEMGLLLIYLLWRQNVPNQHDNANTRLNELAFTLISVGRSESAVRLLDFALHKQPSKKLPELMRRMMVVNLANAHKKIGNRETALKTLETLDWSATADNFQICIASIRDEIDRVASYIPRVKAAGSVTAENFRLWPVFDWVRDNPKVQEAFKAAYGEDLLGQARQSTTSDSPPSAITRH